VAGLRAERAQALAASSQAVQADNDMVQLRDEQEAADADAAVELQGDEDAADAAEQVALEADALAQAAQAFQDARSREYERLEMEAFGGQITRELRSNWSVWLLACAYAGSVHGSMTQVAARAVAVAAMAQERPVLQWGGVHGRDLYELGRTSTRQNSRSAAPPLDHHLLNLLANSGLPHTVLWLSSGSTSAYRCDVEMRVTARFIELKVSTT
jgi:hypothetical protein